MTPAIDTFNTEFLPRQRAGRLLIVFALAFAFFCVLSFLLPHDRYIRYQQLTQSDLFRTRWVYERIHFDKTPIDVAILGSSRVEAAISAPILEKELTEKFGRTIHVANLAVPQEGRNLHYVIGCDLLENHPETRIILLSVVEQADLSHPAFRYLADLKDVIEAPLAINHYYFPDAAFLPYRQMSYFLQTLFPSWFGVSRSFRKDYQGTGFDTTHSFYLPSGKLVDRSVVMPRAKLEAGAQQSIQSLGGEWHQPSAWHMLNNPLETSYTTRLAAVAKQHCAELIFVRLPFYKSPLNAYDKNFYRSLGPLLDEQQLSTDPHNYEDSGHFNSFGIDQTSQWLWQSLAPYLAPLQQGRGCAR
jgi:hypothetical protein